MGAPMQLLGAIQPQAMGTMVPMGPSMMASQLATSPLGGMGANPMAGMSALKGLGGMMPQPQQAQSTPPIASIPLLDRLQTPKLPSTVFRGM